MRFDKHCIYCKVASLLKKLFNQNKKFRVATNSICVSFYGTILGKLLGTIYEFGMTNKSNENKKEGKFYEGC